MKQFWEEFKKFALKGSVLDLAIGVIIGAAFQKIVSALVDNVLMPVVGMMLGGKNFEGLVIQAGNAQIKYGLFISAVIDFTIVAMILFLFVKGINKLRRTEPVPAPAAKEKPPELRVLEEIRDSLKNKTA